MSELPLVATLALLAGAALAWLVLRARHAAVETRLAEREREAATLRAERDTLVAARDAAQADREQVAATLAAERAGAREKVAALEAAEARLRDSFSALAQQALQSSTQTFLDLAAARLGEAQQAATAELEQRRQQIDQLVTPMQQGLARVTEQLTAFDRDRAAGHAALEQHLRLVAEAQQQLAGETRTLVTALRAPQVRGQWGELQLRRCVELAGMLEHCDFVEQLTVQGTDGALRPDLVVRLPGGKVMIVDSKAPLDGYLTALECTDATEQGAQLDRHARQVRDHIVRLAARDYAREFADAPDFVVLFLPGEAFFSAACQRDATLLEFAVQRGVIPASPTTLITLLKAVAYGWQQERLAENAAQIRDLGQQLYDRTRVVAEHFATLRKHLDGAVGAYNSAVGSVESRFLPAARRLHEMRAAQGEELEVLQPIDSRPRLPAAAELVVD